MVDDLADSQVTVMLICCAAQKTCYKSNVWEVFGEGFDPSKDNQQAFFGDVPNEVRDIYRRRVHNLKVMLEAGIDPMQRMIDRARQRGISPYVSVRMNDVHDPHLMNSPFHARFWQEHPEYWRYPDRLDRRLNYAIKPVRDRIMALIREVCDRYDMDGLELDWLRHTMYFREGEEIEQGKMLTEWMVEVRSAVRAAEKKWKHPIRLVARIPTRPEVSLGIGLDAITWARRGLIDHLIVSPDWGTTEFDIPLEQWIEQLKGTPVGVTAGLEALIQSYPGGLTLPNTPERRRGAAMAALGRGSQGIYLFNHYDIGSQLPHLLKEIGSVETLADKDRTYTVTYVNISIPNKPIPASLPKKLAPGQSTEFRVFIGPKPLPTAKGDVQLALKPEKAGQECAVQVAVNGKRLAAAVSVFDADAFREGYNAIRIVNTGTVTTTIEGVELTLRFPK
jgi:hypothetical protein